MTVHLLTLSNHRQAWDMSLGLFAVAATEAQVFFDFASYIYARQDQFYNGPFEHKTHNDLRQLVADFAAEHAGVERTWVLKRMADNDVYIDARTPIRYAATKAVWATPTFLSTMPTMYQSRLSLQLMSGLKRSMHYWRDLYIIKWNLLLAVTRLADC